MGWVRLDDNFADHPKVIALSDTAFRLFVTGLCYSNRHLTDGLVPYQMVSAWVGDNPMKPSDELEDQNLWERVDKGFLIRSYDEYQPTRDSVEAKRQQNKERLARFRERKTQVKRVSNADETLIPTQPNPTQPNSLDIDISKEVEPYESDTPIPLPRVKSARISVLKIHEKLVIARNAGVNSWNLSRLVEEEWDSLHGADDIGGCIALTIWYVAELQSRQLTSAEISRIGQMTKRFGRIALLAIDEAASKDLDDLVSYAFRIAQRMYADRKA
jgi:hypothetical protein